MRSDMTATDTKKGGSRANGNRPSNTPMGANDKPKVQPKRRKRTIPGQLMLPFAYPCAYASQFAPAPRRTQWWVTFKCPHGCGGHFGRSPERIEDGLRRAGCGRFVWLIVARTYLGEAADV